MSRLPVDYAGLVHGLRMPLARADLGAALLDAVAERYEHQFPDCSLLQFVQSGATYLFDLASAVWAKQEDRTLAAWTITPTTVVKRDVSYQRGFPLPPDPDGTLVDRGHLIPHLSGGKFGPNIFRQRRDLNRGCRARANGSGNWSEKRPQHPASSISAICCTRTAPHIPPRSRPACSAGRHCM